MASQPQSRTLLSPVVRLSYPALFEARAMRNPDGTEGKAKYGATLHFDERSKQDPKFKELMKDLVEEVNLFARRRWPDEAAHAKPPFLDDCKLKSPWLDPQSPRYRDKPELKGVIRFIRPSSNRRVPCVNRLRNPITDPELLYPGCYVKALLTVFTYSNTGNFGPGFGLRGIQFVEDGERLDGGVDVSEAFEALDEAGDTPFDTKQDPEAALAAMFG
jgi:hypothetical protein